MRFQTGLMISLLFILLVSCSAQKSSIETYGNIVQTAKLNKARAAHTATRLMDGSILIVGGMERNGVFYDDAEIFYPDKNIFTELEHKMTKKRVSHTATLLLDGKVLIVGGWSNRNNPENTAEIYDPKAQAFFPIGNSKFRRSGHTSTLLENGTVLIMGGHDGERSLNEAEIFNPRSRSFTSIGAMGTRRKAHSATRLNDGRVLIEGGEITRGEITSSAEIFDPETLKFNKITAKMHDIRYKHDAILLADGRVLIFGGSDNRDTRGKLKSAEIFDPAKETFTRANDMSFGRFKVRETAVLLKDGKVLVAGGSEEAEVFDPETISFSPVSGSLGKSLHFASVTLLRDGRALILGGYEFIKGGEPTSTNQAWVFTANSGD